LLTSQLLGGGTQLKENVKIWQEHQNNPLLPLGEKGEWDEVYATWASVLQLNSREWRMYYSGKDKTMHIRIGLALSKDGINWAKYKNNPILDVSPPGNWDSLYVYCPVVWKEGASWKMMFTGCDALDSSHYQVGLAQSSDGINWTKYKNNPVFNDLNPTSKNKFGQYETEGWGLMNDKTGYYLFYNTVTRKPRQVSIAHSTDLISWTPVSKNPVLLRKGFSWQLGYMKYCAWPFRQGKYFYCLASVSNAEYTKSKIGLWRIEGPLNSIRKVEFLGYVLERSAEWCTKELDTPYTIKDIESKRIHCYYSGRSSSGNWTEGLAFTDMEE